MRLFLSFLKNFCAVTLPRLAASNNKDNPLSLSYTAELKLVVEDIAPAYMAPACAFASMLPLAAALRK